MIHSVLDDKIPFVEYFIVPYLLWFVFIAAVFLYFFFTDVEGFYKLAKLSFIGMTIFLLISTVFPNGLTLRPVVFPRDNIFTDMVRMLYLADTPTNVFPSLHVFNSLAACIAIAQSEQLKKHPAVSYTHLEVCAVTGLSDTYAGQGLGAESESDMPILEPVLNYRIELPPDCDIHKMLLNLKELEEEEPELHIVWEERLCEIHAQLMGEVPVSYTHLDVYKRQQQCSMYSSGFRSSQQHSFPRKMRLRKIS